jgi:biopolymer transport protein ExbD
MPFSFRCPGCNAPLSAADYLVGAEAPCPTCELVLEIPDPRTAPARVADRSVHGELVAGEAPIQFRLDQHGNEGEMDMTPMVDVTFLLLIFFMVTAAFTMQKSFEIPTPEQEQASARPIQEFEEDPNYVIVRVDQFNTYHVSAAVWDEEKEAPSEQDLLVRLREARQGHRPRSGAKRMLVMASGEAYHEKVVTALDAGSEVGMEDVKLVTVEDE